jgi:hypothetical protein
MISSSRTDPPALLLLPYDSLEQSVVSCCLQCSHRHLFGTPRVTHLSSEYEIR